MDRDAFFRGQFQAVQKAITKDETPLKPKHLETILLGTHTEKSSAIFWSSVKKIKLENHPVLTWKFCLLVHKLLRDGHPVVPKEAYRNEKRFTQLALHWKDKRDYGPCIDAYCKLLHDRVIFHHKRPYFPGNLFVSPLQLDTMGRDLSRMLRLTGDMMHQMDSLLAFQEKVYLLSNSSPRWDPNTPQGQCLMLPLISVIMDTWPFFIYIVRMMYNLHSNVSPHELEGYRSRFQTIFEKTKQFYEECSKHQYFRCFVQIPTFPLHAPNFFTQSDLESYQTYLIGESKKLTETVTPAEEARTRIEHYENRLKEMHGEFQHVRREADENREEVQRLRYELALRDASRTQNQAAIYDTPPDEFSIKF